jgi:hypothetical protein
MANNLFKINKGLILGAQASAPASPENGAIYYDSTLNQFRKYENGTWGSFGGELSIQATAGENLSANQAVYISKGAADGSRTAGSAYLINPYNDDRVEFQGFVRDTVTTGQTATIIYGGVKTGFSSLTPGLPVYADPAVLGGITQTVNTTIGTWLLNLGQATTATTVRVNPSAAATAVYIDSLAQSNVTIINNQVSALAIPGMLFYGSTSAFVEYVINRSSSTTDLAQTGTITITKKPVAGTWTLTDTYSGDNAGVTFSIDSSGQIYYTSTSVGGTGYAGTLSFNTRDNGNSIVKFAPTIQKFTSGSGTYTVPTINRPLYVRVRMSGGGGGGGGGSTNAGAGGGAGAYLEFTLSNFSSPTYSYTVGAGGAGAGAGGTGTAGSSSLFGANTCAGGSGGNGNGSNGGLGGSVTVQTLGTIVAALKGGDGGSSGNGGTGFKAGDGGTNPFGCMGGGVQSTNGTGRAGTDGTGAGGGGGQATSGGGGKGGDGVIIVEEYYQ